MWAFLLIPVIGSSLRAMGAVPSPQQHGAHVGSGATWQKWCWIELCRHTKPMHSSALHRVSAAGPSQREVPSNAISNPAALVSHPTQLHTTRTKKRKSRWEQPGLCEQAAGEVLCQEVGVEPLLTVTPCTTPSVSHPYLGLVCPWPGQECRECQGQCQPWWSWVGMGLPESAGGDGPCREMQELCSWRSMGWALPPQCQLHLSLQKSCVRVGSSGRVLVWGQQRLPPAAEQDLQGATVFSWLFSVSQISSVCQLSTLSTFDNLCSLPNMIWWCATQVIPRKVTFHSGVTESDLSLPLSCESPCGWECCGGVWIQAGAETVCSYYMLPQNREQQGPNSQFRFQAVIATGVIKVSQKWLN